MLNFDVLVPNAPVIHAAPGTGIKIDCVRAHQRAAVIVDHILVPRAENAEAGAQRESGPVRGRAPEFSAGETVANGVAPSRAFVVGVRRGADLLHSAMTCLVGDPAGLGRAARK